jgi:metal-responsive CopG/Arc/MetJ family transcriptional regulator
MPKQKKTNSEIVKLYEKGEFRFSQERSDFLLPQIIDFVKQKKWLNLRPEYQRRLVWDRRKKSRFIESLLMNVPVPPVFLFETDYSRYEVMDGQQRLNAIVEFYNNEYKLIGLEEWGILNGRYYKELPTMIQRGLDRRRISATVLLAENAKSELDKISIRRTVFERLNTGGMTLTAQELRNSLYFGSFNDLLLKLAGDSLFDDIWGIPRYEDHIKNGNISPELANNSLFRRMADCEIVLRFFAFRREEKIKGSVRRILDTCMMDYQNEDKESIAQLRHLFETRLNLAYEIFKPDPFNVTTTKGGEERSESLYDAIMVALDRNYDKKEILLRHSDAIKKLLKLKLKNEKFYTLVVGGPNTAEGIKERSKAVEKILRKYCKKR